MLNGAAFEAEKINGVFVVEPSPQLLVLALPFDEVAGEAHFVCAFADNKNTFNNIITIKKLTFFILIFSGDFFVRVISLYAKAIPKNIVGENKLVMKKRANKIPTAGIIFVRIGTKALLVADFR